MKLPLFAALVLAAMVLTAAQTGPSRIELTEFFAVSDDGPYSYLPDTGPGYMESSLAELAGLDDNPEIVTAEEARMTGLLLDVLAGDPTDPSLQEAPLDEPPASGSAVVVAGL